MQYLHHGCLAAASPEGFRNQQPYPWLKMQNALADEGFRRLCENMPDVSLFTRDEGVNRAYGQAPHDRYTLHYWAGLRLPHLASLAPASLVRKAVGVIGG